MQLSDYKYLRIEGEDYAENTMHPIGVFGIFRKLMREHEMEEEDEDLFREADLWIAEILPYPDPCRKRERVICYFKTDNSEEMMKMIRPALWLLDEYHKPYHLVLTNTPGEIVYEDDYQVAVRVSGELNIQEMPDDWGVEGLSS